MLLEKEKQIKIRELSVQDIFNDYVNKIINDIVKNGIENWGQKMRGIIGFFITLSKYLFKDNYTFLVIIPLPLMDNLSSW